MDAIEKTIPDPAETTTGSQEVTRQPERYAVPPVDIFEDGETLVVLADLPGVRKEGLEVKVEEGLLTIEGRVERDTPGQLLRREFSFVPFFRQFRITETVDTARIKASLKNGVLRLDLPRAEAARPRRIPLEP